MGSSTRIQYPFRLFYLIGAAITMNTLLCIGSVNAEEIDVPRGYHPMPRASDATGTATASEYRAADEAVLKSLGNDSSAAPASDAADQSTAIPASPGYTLPNASSIAEPDSVAATVDAFEELSAASQPMANGGNLVTNPATVVASTMDEPEAVTPASQAMPADQPVADKPLKSATATIDDFTELPPGYHTMPDGTVMANNPSKAVAPPGYHLMPDGTLMAEGAGANVAEHDHRAGGMLMGEYKYERMSMKDFLDTTTKVSPAEVIDAAGTYRYRMAPTDMTMDMHMFMLMYHTRSYMLMAMAHYMSNDMGMLARDGTKSTMHTSGIADTIVTFTAPWRFKLSYTVGLSIPTGSIDEHGPMTHAANVTTDEKYPYGMQLGSGTYDVLLGVDYEDTAGSLAWGAGFEYTLRTGTNDNDYTLGDKSIVDGWMRLNFTSTVNGTAMLQYREVGQISGADPDLDKSMSPAADADNYGGRRLDLGLAIKYETPQMTSVAAEFTVPVYQNLWGPQMKTDWIAGIKLGYMF